MNPESELKFRVEQGQLKSLADMNIAGLRLGKAQDRHLTSTYFDTPKQKLRRHGLTLRVRTMDDEFVQTVKTAAAGHAARGEWETKVKKPTPVFDHIAKTPLAPLATKKTRRKLAPIFETSVHRTTRPIHAGTSEIELAIDRGNLRAGPRSEPIAEFELELKKGEVADLFRVVRTLEDRTGAELYLRSKAERGFRLTNGERQVAAHAEPIELTAKMTAEEAFNVIAYSSLRHFSANADGIRALDTEALHQMRVGLRRLRAAISLFKGVLAERETTGIKSELKWLTGELARAREIDVFVKERIRPLEEDRIEPESGIRAIEEEFSEACDQAFRKAREALATERYRRLLIDVLEWLERRRGNGQESKTPIGDFVNALMRRRTRKAIKAGRHLDDLTARERHKLRIGIKKIRYGVDFFESLYPRKAQATLQQFSKRLKKIQDALGALNDFVAHQGMAAKAALNAPREHRRARAFASGLMVGQEREASKTLLAEAAKQIRHLRPLQAKPG